MSDALPVDVDVEAAGEVDVEAVATSLVAPTLDAQGNEITFDSLNLNPSLLAAVKSSGYTIATPIQARAIPPLLEGRDVLGQAQTGTGKTAAFALPMLQHIDLAKRSPQVLVLTPTRELAIQVAEAFERYATGMPGLRVVPIYGGQDYQVQFRALDRGVHVVVGTPGRVMDHMRRGSIELGTLRGLVLDEADEMLRMGFADDVEWVLTQAPIKRQIALFSATMPESIRRIAQQHLHNPVEITIAQKTATADTINQRFVVVPPQQKKETLARILEAEAVDGVIVFVQAKSTTEPLAEYLATQGHRTAALSSDVAQKSRERIVDNLRSGKIDVIVATDVAARGLDVQRISHVINYDFPFDSESYVHRIGRTGRAGRTGNAILFLRPREQNLLRRIERATRGRIEQMQVPTKRDINKRRVARFHEKITEALAKPEMMNTYLSLVEQYRKEKDVPAEQIAAALAVMYAGDTPLLVTEDLHKVEFFGRDNERRENFERGPGSFERDRRNGPPMRNGDRRSGPNRNSPPMETFRIEVGHANQVKPGNIVGAIASVTGLDSSNIGRIEIYDDYSTVDLLAGMPHELFHSLKQVWVAGRRLNITRLNEAPEFDNRPTRKTFKPKSKDKKKRVPARA
jgi:ATP-dependent RNA helicase DeaD